MKRELKRCISVYNGCSVLFNNDIICCSINFDWLFLLHKRNVLRQCKSCCRISGSKGLEISTSQPTPHQLCIEKWLLSELWLLLDNEEKRKNVAECCNLCGEESCGLVGVLVVVEGNEAEEDDEVNLLGDFKFDSGLGCLKSKAANNWFHFCLISAFDEVVVLDDAFDGEVTEREVGRSGVDWVRKTKKEKVQLNLMHELPVTCGMPLLYFLVFSALSIYLVLLLQSVHILQK